jgi:hypothetical protein
MQKSLKFILYTMYNYEMGSLFIWATYFELHSLTLITVPPSAQYYAFQFFNVAKVTIINNKIWPQLGIEQIS